MHRDMFGDGYLFCSVMEVPLLCIRLCLDAVVAGSRDKDTAWKWNHCCLDLLCLHCGRRQHFLPVCCRGCGWSLSLACCHRSRYLKLTAYIIVLRQRQTEFSLCGKGTDAYVAKHQQRQQDARKSIKTTNANLLAGGLEDLPFGVLGLLYVAGLIPWPLNIVLKRVGTCSRWAASPVANRTCCR